MFHRLWQVLRPDYLSPATRKIGPVVFTISQMRKPKVGFVHRLGLPILANKNTGCSVSEIQILNTQYLVRSVSHIFHQTYLHHKIVLCCSEMEISGHPVFHLVTIWGQTNPAHTVAEPAQCQRLGLTTT